MTWRGRTDWLVLVPVEGRVAIREIIHDVEAEDPNHRARWFFRWAVLCTPSTGTSTDVVLIARGDISERRWTIVRHGELVAGLFPDVGADKPTPTGRHASPAHGPDGRRIHHRRPWIK